MGLASRWRFGAWMWLYFKHAFYESLIRECLFIAVQWMYSVMGSL